MQITCFKARVSDVLFFGLSYANFIWGLFSGSLPKWNKQTESLLASVPDGPSIDLPSQGRSIDHLLGGTQPFFTIQYALQELTVKLFVLFNKQIDCRAQFHLVTMEVQTSFLPFVKHAFFFSKNVLELAYKICVKYSYPSFYHENMAVTVQCLLTKSSDSYYIKEVDQYWQ